MVVRQTIFAPPGLKQSFCQSPYFMLRASRWPRAANSSVAALVAVGGAVCAKAGSAADRANAAPKRRPSHNDCAIVPHFCLSRNAPTSGDQIGTASAAPTKKCPSLPCGGNKWYSALPPAAVKAVCIRFESSGPKKVSFSIYIHSIGTREVRPNSPVASTSLSGAQLLLGLPSTRPPRPAAKVMIAFTGGGLTLDSAIDAQPPADCPTTMTLLGTMRFSVPM